MHPWEYSREVSIYNGYTSRPYKTAPNKYSYKVIKEYIDDTPRQNCRKGDIVKFMDGAIPPWRESWVDWFATKKDQRKLWRRIPSIAKYADNQLAIIIGRYRKIKLKARQTFIDYGFVTMLLTGPKAGKTRHYWMQRPFVIKCRYSKNIKFKYMLKTIPPEVIDIFHQKHEDTNEGRNKMIHEIYKVFHKE